MITSTSRYRPPAVPPDACAVIRRQLAAARVAAGLSPEALSAAAGLSRSAVRLIELGRSVPSLGTLYAVAGPLGCHPADLLRPAENKSKKS